MFNLFDVATVTDHDSTYGWSPGEDFEAIRCGTGLFIQDPCSPISGLTVAGATSGAAVPIYNVKAFSAVVSALRPTRCEGPDDLKIISDLLNEQTTRVAEYALWNGAPSWGAANPFLLNGDVETVSAGASVTDSLIAALELYDNSVVNRDDLILHLGVASALNLPDGNNTMLAKLFPNRVVSGSYPNAGIAITGPISVAQGPLEEIAIFNTSVNRTLFQANRLMKLQFDPCSAVRVV